MAAPICQQRVQPARRLGVFGTLVLVASATLIVLQMSEGPARAAFPGSNGRIAFVGRDRSGIFAINPDGTDKERLTQNPAGAPAYSPNGNKIAYSRGYPGDIYKMSADGSKRRRLRGDGVSPTWSANGKRIAFASAPGGQTDIYRMKATGSKRRRLTNTDAFDYAPAWSPTKAKIAFIRERADGGGGEIVVMNGDGSGEHRITDTPNRYEVDLDWSPNGKRLVFAATRVPGRYDVFTMEADGTKTRRLTRKGIDDYSPAWSPDGTRIAFIRLGSLYTMTADGSDKHEVTSYAGEPDWQSR